MFPSDEEKVWDVFIFANRTTSKRRRSTRRRRKRRRRVRLINFLLFFIRVALDMMLGCGGLLLYVFHSIMTQLEWVAVLVRGLQIYIISINVYVCLVTMCIVGLR